MSWAQFLARKSWVEKVDNASPLYFPPPKFYNTTHNSVKKLQGLLEDNHSLSIIKPATATAPTVKMTTLRQFKMDDLLKFNNVNLDVLTETYNMPFVSSIRPVVLPCPSLVSHRLDLSLNHCSIYLTCRGGQNLSVVRNTLVPQHTHSCGEY